MTRSEFITKAAYLSFGLSVLNEEAQSFSEKPIIKKKIPATGEALPAIGMGTWQTFDVGSFDFNRSNIKEVLKNFVVLGGTVLDSSPMYGNAEEVLGDLSTELQISNSLFIATKVWTNGVTEGILQMENSMKLLRRKVDLMQVHNLVDVDVHMKTLRRWKEEGKIRYIGITHYTDNSHNSLASYLKKYPIDFVQVNYSIQSRGAEKLLLPLAIDKGVAVIVNRPFESGEIFSKVKGKPLPAWAPEINCQSWAQYFLKYIISNPAVTCAIPASEKLMHLKDNMGALFGSLPDANMRKQMEDYFQSL